MEAAVRLANVVTACEIAELNEPNKHDIAVDRFIAQHALFTLLNYEWSDLHGNHALADAVGILYGATWLAGSSFGELLARVGRRLFLYEARRQLREDGAPREGSTTYHVLIAELALHGIRLLERLGRPVPSDVRRRLASVARVLDAIRSPQDGVLRLGDSDDGRLLRLGRDAEADIACIIDSAAIVAGLSSIAGSPSTEGERALRLASGSIAEQRATRSLLPRPIRPSILSAGGFVAAHAPPFVLVTRAGGETLRGRGHAHADLLSVVVEIDGRPFIIDPGNNLYGSPEDVRLADISSQFHNAPCLDDGYETVIGKIQAIKEVAGTVRRVNSLDDSVEFVASHAGYASVGAHVSRRVRIGGRGMLLEDRIRVAADNRHRLTMAFTLAPRLGVTINDGQVTVWRSEVPVAIIDLTVPPSMTIRTGSRIVYPRYGRPCQCSEFRIQGSIVDRTTIIRTLVTAA